MTEAQKQRAQQMRALVHSQIAADIEAEAKSGKQAAKPAPPPKPEPRPTTPARVQRIAPTGAALHAVQTGITNRTAVLSPEDALAYEAHIQRMFEIYEPAGHCEEQVIQAIADIEWRLLRIPSLESGIYAIGRLEFKTAFDAEDPSVRPALIEAQTFLKYQRQLNSLGTQEVRLRRQLNEELATFDGLKTRRLKEEHERLNEAALRYLKSKELNQSFDMDQFGFEFSIEEIQYAAYGIEQQRRISPLGRRLHPDAA